MLLQIIGQTPGTPYIRVCCVIVGVFGNVGVSVKGSPDSGTLHASRTVYSVGRSRGGAPPKTAAPRRTIGIGVHVVTTCPLSPPFFLPFSSPQTFSSPPFALIFSSFVFDENARIRAFPTSSTLSVRLRRVFLFVPSNSTPSSP